MRPALLASLLLAALPSAALAQDRPPPPPPAGRPASGPSQLLDALRQEGISAAGAATVGAWATQQDGERSGFQSRWADLDRENAALLGAPHLDLPRFGQLLQRRDALQAEMRSAATRALVDLLARLSEPDQMVVLRVFGLTPQQPDAR